MKKSKESKKLKLMLQKALLLHSLKISTVQPPLRPGTETLSQVAVFPSLSLYPSFSQLYQNVSTVRLTCSSVMLETIVKVAAAQKISRLGTP